MLALLLGRNYDSLLKLCQKLCSIQYKPCSPSAQYIFQFFGGWAWERMYQMSHVTCSHILMHGGKEKTAENGAEVRCLGEMFFVAFSCL